jgi:lycopene cyclase domain-containing protein
MHLTYILLLLFSILIPILRSFEPRIYFRQYWQPLFTGILLMMLVFIPWDILFTRTGVWGFNHQYVMGIFILGLPLEEWLFFVFIPYCVVFSYEVVSYFMPQLKFPRTSLALAVIAGITAIIIGFVNLDKVYTSLVMLLAGSLLLLQPLIGSHKTWLSKYFLTYGFMLLPFFIVNGVLTAFPVVWYNNDQNLGIRLGTIPVEDLTYFMAMMLIVFVVYEAGKGLRRVDL